MTTSRSLLIPLLIFVLILSVSCQTQQDSSSCPPVNKFRKDFWIESNYGCCSQYLINVLLPDNYYDENTATYPVVYQLDADLCFGVLADRSQFISQSRQHVIIVGVSYVSTESWMINRRKDLLPTPNEHGIPGDENFRLFLELELIPQIESKFRTEKGNNTLIGLSWSGSFALNTLLHKPALFKNYIVGGWVPENHWYKAMKKNDLRNYKNLYVAVGEYENSQKLKDIGTQIDHEGINNLLFRWDVLEGRGHEYSAFADVIIRGLDYCFGKKSLSEEMIKEINRSSVNYAIQKYRQWQSTMPDQFNFNPTELKHVADYLAAKGLKNEKAKITKIIQQEHPLQLVTIITKPKVMPENERVFITGNHSSIGEWEPDFCDMSRQADGNWSKTLQIEKGMTLEFKFTRGSWATESVDASGKIPGNINLLINSDTTVTYEIFNWADLR